eukprot:COSAG05_NODE_20435_length_279_cov_0.861111_2_plen_58_part_01
MAVREQATLSRLWLARMIIIGLIDDRLPGRTLTLVAIATCLARSQCETCKLKRTISQH